MAYNLDILVSTGALLYAIDTAQEQPLPLPLPGQAPPLTERASVQTAQTGQVPLLVKLQLKDRPLQQQHGQIQAAELHVVLEGTTFIVLSSDWQRI